MYCVPASGWRLPPDAGASFLDRLGASSLAVFVSLVPVSVGQEIEEQAPSYQEACLPLENFLAWGCSMQAELCSFWVPLDEWLVALRYQSP